jgi:hypothetical protein
MSDSDRDPAGFRIVAARFVKSLIAARWKVEPGFLDREALRRWKLEDIEDDTWSAAARLRRAAAALAELNREYFSRCGSGGIQEGLAWTPLELAVAFLVDPEGGAPAHNLGLLVAARALDARTPVAWETLAHWESLPQIRDGLDRLPENTVSEVVDHCHTYVIGGESFALDGATGRLRRGDREVEIERASKVGRCILKMLLRSYPVRITTEKLWKHCTHAETLQSSLYKEIPLLRELLGELDLGIENKPVDGYRLFLQERV